jgi:hypothetical protein
MAMTRAARIEDQPLLASDDDLKRLEAMDEVDERLLEQFGLAEVELADWPAISRAR